MKTQSIEAYVEFASSASSRLMQTAMLLTTDRHLAEDLVQETLGKLYASWRKMANVSNPHAYARATLVNTYLSHRRWRCSSEIPAETMPEQPGAVTDLPLRLTLLDGLGRLAPKDRAVLVLRYWDDLTVEQTAHELGLTPGAVRNRSMRALAKLREDLGEDLRLLAY
jgi:RNA polymerase sigma-70 factor (sigma-E family)